MHVMPRSKHYIVFEAGVSFQRAAFLSILVAVQVSVLSGRHFKMEENTTILLHTSFGPVTNLFLNFTTIGWHVTDCKTIQTKCSVINRASFRSIKHLFSITFLGNITIMKLSMLHKGYQWIQTQLCMFFLVNNNFVYR